MRNVTTDDNGSLSYLLGVTFVATLGGLLFGYDTAVISGAIGFLKARFGLDAVGEGWAASSALVGCFFGAAMAGVLSDRLGRKRTLILAALLFLISAIGTAVPQTMSQFVIFRIVGGVGVGIASMVSPMYIAELSPAHIRGRMVSLNQLAIVSGMLVVYFVNYFIALQGNEAWNVERGWRWMFGSESIPASLLLVLMFFVPRTPRWLVKQGCDEEARAILTRIGGRSHADTELQEIEKTIAQESASLRESFRTGMGLLVFVGVSLAVLQQITGINVFLYYAPEIFKKLGAGTNAALMQTIVVGAVNMLCTLIAIWTVDRIGRKPLLYAGASGMGICLFALGYASYVQRIDAWALIFVLGYIGCFAMSMGPVVWVILSEIFPTKIRGRIMAIATFSLWGANWAVSQTFPMMSENTVLLKHFNGAFPFWVYATFCVVTVLFVWRFIPETKGRTLEEIERMLGHVQPKS